MPQKTKAGAAKPVERLYPFARRARAVLDGRPALRANVRRLHFVLVAEDLSEAVRAAVEEEFGHVPIVQRHRAAQLAELLGISGGRIVGFLKSAIARSIYSEMKDHRVAAPSRRLESKRRARVRAAHPGDPAAKKAGNKAAKKKATKKSATRKTAKSAAKKAAKKAVKRAANKVGKKSSKKSANKAAVSEKPSRKQRAMARAGKTGASAKKSVKKSAKKSAKPGKGANKAAKSGASANKPVRRKPVKQRKLARLAAKRARAQAGASSGDGDR